jgi:signal transduction histidine kinase/DNA-binding NarL/FixJ family response regulator
MRHKIRSSHFAILVGAFLVFAIVLSSAISIWVAREQAIEEWTHQLGNLSLVVAEQTSQEVTSAYLILDSIVEAVQKTNVHSAAELRVKMATRDVHDSMQDKKSAVPQIDVASIVAQNGDVINFTRTYPAPEINLADRDYFKEHLSFPNLGVFISKPVRNKGDGAWTFYLSRRLSGPHGEFIGLALVGFSSTFLSDFYKKINLGGGAAITLYRRDFTVLARWPLVPELMGQVNRSGSSYTVIEEMNKGADVLVTSGPRFAQRGELIYRMGAPRLIDKYPLIINITVTEDLFLAQWHRFAWIILIVAGCSIVAIVIALAMLVKSLKRRELDMEVTEQLKSEAEAASLAKSEFLAMMSHEIRTPLTSIIGFAEVLDSSTEPAVYHDAGQIILRNGRHLLSIINDILDISKVEAGRLLFEQVAFSPIELLAEIDSMMAAQARSKGIDFHIEIDYPMPEQVIGDPTRWKQILFNLCGNAIKFTELGDVRLRLAYGVAGGLLRCAVSDTGIGMSQQQINALFQPFAQADSAIARKYGGTGLGLHLVRQLAEKMGGTISVRSAVGHGSIFDVTVVARPAAGTAWLECAPEPLSALTLALAPPAVPSAAQGLRGRVLLAEDGPDNRKLIKAFLARLGLEFTVVENGAQALEAALAESFDLILMDVHMPVLDGIAATRALRASGCGVPIVALTANVMAEDVQRYLKAGCTRCVGKPIDFVFLTECMAQLLPDQGKQPLAAASAEELDGFADIRQAFELGLPARLREVREGIASGDWEPVGEQLHMLKGSAGSFGYPRVTEMAREMESALRAGDTVALERLMQQLMALEEIARLPGVAEEKQ